MSDPPQPGEDQRPTPDERSHVRQSANPRANRPKFEEGKTAWLKAGKGHIDVTIWDRVEEGGQFYYKVADKNGKLLKSGNRVPEKDLKHNC